ncbi:STAS-like domain-containing protein [Paracoccus sp. TK19116]|uniref:STAS-like domain-containing protein n=1 Tax=Paracoccus albicereus TaxID=2922394 RepID=A0ABT1MV40_9RHOB|nr:STAS-like domain-containing protein [Paracoccus albicereus]MCQ0971539.1 STAS-like domain-containing protein [Paracoccus albicereus]
MAEPMHLSIASEFSPFPAGRVESDGPFNGSKFRETLLLPMLKQALTNQTSVIVSLAGVMSFGSSFFEEAFGGAVRSLELPTHKARSLIKIDAGEAENERYQRLVEKHILKAAKKF